MGTSFSKCFMGICLGFNGNSDWRCGLMPILEIGTGGPRRVERLTTMWRHCCSRNRPSTGTSQTQALIACYFVAWYETKQNKLVAKCLAFQEYSVARVRHHQVTCSQGMNLCISASTCWVLGVDRLSAVNSALDLLCLCKGRGSVL